MDRRLRGRGGETLAAPLPRAGRPKRAAEVVVILDDGDDDDEGAALAPEPPIVSAGAVAMRTRSRRMAMLAPAPVAPSRKRGREGARRPRPRRGGGEGEGEGEGATVGKNLPSSGKRPGRAPLPAARRKGKGKAVEAESEAEEEAPASGRGGGASSHEDEDSIDQRNGDRCSASSRGRGHQHCSNEEEVSVNRVMNKLLSGDADGCDKEGGRKLGGYKAQHEEAMAMGDDETEDCENNKGAHVITEAVPPFDDDEMLEEKLVGDVIRAYSTGGDFDADGVDWEAEDEMESDDDDYCMDDAEEAGMSRPMHDDDYCMNDADDDSESMHGDAKVATQHLVDHKVVLAGVGCHQEVIKDEVEPKREGTMDFNQGSLHIEILDSDEEVRVLNDASKTFKAKPVGQGKMQAKMPIVSSCVAWRTRSSWGIKQDRLSYNTYFETLSDEPKEDDDDDTEVELDDGEENGNSDDDHSGSSYNGEEEEEEKEEKEEEAERRRHKKEVDSSDDDMISDDDIIDAAGIESEEDEDQEVGFIRPRKFKKYGNEVPVGNDTITEQQKLSRFTWELERRKKLKLGIANPRPYERDLDSDSNSSGSGRNRRDGLKGIGDKKAGRRKKHSLLKSGKKSSHSTALKRQSLMKLLMDKMCGDKDGESFPFDQKPQIGYNCKYSHPLVFSFGDEDPIPTDRSEQDASLWADFDFALESENIGTYYDDEGQEESNLVGFSLASITPCSRGKHEFIIDEQIGIRCKYCSLVNLEIRFILPILMSNFSEKPVWRNASCLKNALMHHDLCEREGNDDGKPQDFHLYGTVWDLIPGVINTMYQHQSEAFEFMWTNLVGDIRLDELKHGAKPDVVGGCVICHAPGTGKTRLAIVFIQTYMKVFPDCRPVIIAPRGMLFAWEEEFKKWNVNVPFHILNTTDYSGKEDREICRLIKKKHRTEKLTRLVKLLSWNKGHGILGISYGLYTKLTSEKPDCTEDKVRSILLENPGLLVLDEGHTPRNERSVMWKTLGKVKTEKRIILSGTPFQNNFLELYNILCLVRPRFGEMFLSKGRVGRRHHVPKKQRDKFSDKYEKGVWASLTSNVIDDNAEKVRSILKPFVHIHNGNILRTLPGLRECVIVLKPLALQKSIIRKVENIGSGNNFEHEYVISLASTHPSLVTAINMTEEEASLIDKPALEKLRSNPYAGVKTRFVIEVVRLCEALKEKVLIFSQFIQPLELIKEHLRKLFKWRDGKEILQMDGKILPRYRQTSIEVFNNPDSDARVLLASTRACCEGISLTGASRVVLLDVVWNPAVGRQAISRAFRIGQKKFVYTYNLITYGTGEGDKYDRQAEKDHLSKLVFSAEDEFNNVRSMLSKTEMEHCSKLISEDKVLEEMTSHDQLKGMFLKIHYPPTESNIVYTYNQIAPELG